MSKKLTDKQIVAIAEKAFISSGGCKLPKTLEEAINRENGDGLADFIVIELLEASDGNPAECERLMRYASEQLAVISNAFARLVKR